MKRPPFCPNPSCRVHYQTVRPPHWYARSGTYSTRLFGQVQRFVCTVCGKRFSSQTFSIDYYVKKRVDYRRLLQHLRTTSSSRDMAREMRVSIATIDNRTERLCRSMMKAHQHLLSHHAVQEDMVADGFESYTVSQYCPNTVNLLVGKESQFVYGLTVVPMRRKGRMTEAQKRRREEVEKRFLPPPRAMEDGFARLLLDAEGIIERSSREPVYLYTDEKREYPPVIRSLKVGERLHHVRISSHAPRTLSNALFSVNYLDREIRKDQANHVRETVCFARNVNHAITRLMVYVMAHNYLKVYREKERKRDPRTHAEVAGIGRQTIAQEFRQVFTRRAFFQRSGVQGFVRDLWLKRLETPLKIGRDYLPMYAYV